MSSCFPLLSDRRKTGALKRLFWLLCAASLPTARQHRNLKPRPSIGVRPEPKLLLASRPKSSKAMGFDDQQPADQGPCDNEDQERHGLDRDRDADGMRHLFEQDRQHQDERGAEERA